MIGRRPRASRVKWLEIKRLEREAVRDLSVRFPVYYLASPHAIRRFLAIEEPTAYFPATDRKSGGPRFRLWLLSAPADDALGPSRWVALLKSESATQPALLSTVHLFAESAQMSTA